MPLSDRHWIHNVHSTSTRRYSVTFPARWTFRFRNRFFQEEPSLFGCLVDCWVEQSLFGCLVDCWDEPERLFGRLVDRWVGSESTIECISLTSLIESSQSTTERMVLTSLEAPSSQMSRIESSSLTSRVESSSPMSRVESSSPIGGESGYRSRCLSKANHTATATDALLRSSRM